jgi:ABC-2 type transport system permease protein
MITAVRVEWLKLRTVRLNLILLGCAVGVVLLVATLVATLSSEPEATTSEDLVGVLTGFGVLVAMAVGVVTGLGITADFGHNTIRPTLAAMPKRTVVFAAKAVLSLLVGGLTGFVAIATSYVVSSSLINGRGADVALSAADGTRAAVVGVPILCALLGLFGYGVGLIVRNSPATVSLVILWPLLIESIISAVLSVAGVEDAAKYMPYTAGFSLVIPDTSDAPASRLFGGVYLGIVSLALAVVGIVINSRRDV